MHPAPNSFLSIGCPASKSATPSGPSSEGYRVERIAPFDFFPQTPHVETLTILRR